jgi:hypothetical protein
MAQNFVCVEALSLGVRTLHYFCLALYRFQITFTHIHLIPQGSLEVGILVLFAFYIMDWG